MSDRLGYVYEVVESTGIVRKGSIVVMSKDDGSTRPFFDIIVGTPLSYKDRFKERCVGLRVLKQLWPIPASEPVETITLMGREYDKTEIESALKDVLPVS